MLWTGGWDSTYRVADLVLHHGRTVQPWYVVDRERRTTDREFAAMRSIREAMYRKDPRTTTRLRPSIVRDARDLRDDALVDEAMASIRRRAPLPEQYALLCVLMRREGIVGMELGIDERATMPVLADAVLTHGPGPAPDDWYTVDVAGNPDDLVAVFGAFRLPISELTKAQTAQQARAKGFADVLELTWFCRWPTVFGRPCGQCVPCTDTRTGGLPRRVPPDSQMRRRLHRWHWTLVRQRESAWIRARAATGRLSGGVPGPASRVSR